MIVIAGESVYRDLLPHATCDAVTGNAWFAGVALMRDPLLKGIVMSRE
jgi:hypothetical protein